MLAVVPDRIAARTGTGAVAGDRGGRLNPGKMPLLAMAILLHGEGRGASRPIAAGLPVFRSEA